MRNTSEIDHILKSFQQEGLPFCRCMATQNGKTIYARCFGFLDEAKTQQATMSDLVHLYSATKLIVCITALQALEEGLLSLDTPVSDYLPAYLTPLVCNEAGVHPAANPITIRHLFCMTAGLDYGMERPSVSEYCKAHPKASTREIVARFIDEPLCFEPGSHFLYSLCHDVLGAVLEVVYGASLGSILSQKVFEPLGMRHTAFIPLTDETHRLAPLVSNESGFLRFHALDPLAFPSSAYESGGAGLYSCAEDYIILLNTLSLGGVSPDATRVFSPFVLRCLAENRLDASCLADLHLMPELIGYGWSLGVRTLVAPQKSNASIPRGEFGWSGAAGVYTLVDTTNHFALYFDMQVLCYQSVPHMHLHLRDAFYRVISAT